MPKPPINQFWIWTLSSAAVIGLLIIALPSLQSLLTGLPTSSSRPLNEDGHQDTQRTIYNPSDDALRSSSASRENSNFLFEFLERPDIESLDSAIDGAWNQAMNTPLGGFLLVRHNETYSQGWGVSMFHSIHCLGILRSTMQNYFGLASDNGGHGAHAHGQRDGATLHVGERNHVEHCLGYIGRALLCNGDDTLEPPFTKYDAEGNIVLSAVSGQGHQHSCRDSTLAWKTVLASEENPVQSFDWSPGATIRSVFGKK
ncbi:hypothetical protein M441DRAFT_194351 [Trichoderma asperellum CBS 433.97]|uniref:Uncharacterized protein n=2 Tax=Trichoderma asperellum TaxID=101201 RepID=A0A2T3Z873_TRIA4|nr:hypothetical protein M441DRAFT_194351 [Trichoderma asperellum CBS 433.97]PTB41007.1 hypothetical protein M441DRAFT_194351 [Trichoderma asperellum CBS 433.97]